MRRAPSAFAWAVVGACLTAPGALAAQAPLELAEAPGRPVFGAAIDSARAAVVARMEEARIPGASVAVGVDGELVWAEGFGWADVENRVSVDPASRFRVASISKALTAAAVAQLHQEGRLELDAPVQEYVPEFPEKRGVVTTRLLGGHLAGVRHYRGEEFLNRDAYSDVVEALEIFAADTLLFEPGSSYSYSTYGWNLVSAVVARADGRPFLASMRTRVLEPLRMHETVAEHGDSIISGRVRPYVEADDGVLLNAPWVDNSNKWAGGGYLSTARDLVTYGQAWLDPDFLEPATVEEFWRPQRTTDGELQGYAIGWRSAEEEGRRQIWHTGGAVGGTTILLIWPDDGIVVSILTNLQGAGQVETSRAVAHYFAGAR